MPVEGLAGNFAERAGIRLVEVKGDRICRSLILGEQDCGWRDHARDFANLFVVVPAVSHAVAGPSALKAGVLHGDDSAMWSVPRSSCSRRGYF